MENLEAKVDLLLEKVDELNTKVDTTNSGIHNLIAEVKQTGTTLMETVENSPIGSLLKSFARK